MYCMNLIVLAYMHGVNNLCTIIHIMYRTIYGVINIMHELHRGGGL